MWKKHLTKIQRPPVLKTNNNNKTIKKTHQYTKLSSICTRKDILRSGKGGLQTPTHGWREMQCISPTIGGEARMSALPTSVRHSAAGAASAVGRETQVGIQTGKEEVQWPLFEDVIINVKKKNPQNPVKKKKSARSKNQVGKVSRHKIPKL